MQRFDCLARDCPLLGPHLLEASAGTGKTFSIEHIYVRLILESIEVEQILAVTFTRAATRELKARIRSNLEKALHYLEVQETTWEYLEPYLTSLEAKRRLSDAIACFDHSQIFTIHGFCYRMLKEFAFEAKMCLSLPDPDGELKVPPRLKQAAYDFLESGIDQNLLCPEQLTHLLKQFDSVDEIVKKLLLLQKTEGISFAQLFANCKAAAQNHKKDPFSGAPLDQCKAALHFGIEEEKLLEDFRAIEGGYKSTVKRDFISQVRHLAKWLNDLENPHLFKALLKENGTLFDFLSPSNKKIRAIDPPFLHYPHFFDWARTTIAPFVQQSAKEILATLQAGWLPIAEKILAEEEYLSPDEILTRMKKSVTIKPFAESIQNKYQAVIIDEFQDTDEMQWDIFQKLFVEKSLKALYLVGDPKQSIYRFRKADVYTYLKARDFLGVKHLYHLDTNFRSSEKLVGALNALFDREWLHLPKVNQTLSYYPVKAGAKIMSNFSDDKGAIHFLLSEGDPKLLFEETFLPFAVSEIEKLGKTKCAILVKDRYQAEMALNLLKDRGIEAIAKSHTPLGKTLAFQSVRELFDAIISPQDQTFSKVVQAGPFRLSGFSFRHAKMVLEEKGLVPFARSFLTEEMKEKLSGSGLFDDVMQIFEILFSWEKNEGFSFEGLGRFLRSLRDLEADEGGRRRMAVDDEAVQIMTLHISKGLEFDVVFAIGLISQTPSSDDESEEFNAEKLRQLYVAMTRAKKRLYVPLVLSETESKLGTYSPMELFCSYLKKESSIMDQIRSLAKKEAITWELLPARFELDSPKIAIKEVQIEKKEWLAPIFNPSYLSSFTSMVKSKEHETKLFEAPNDLYSLQTMPRGAETGVEIHKIFELLFSSKEAIWQSENQINKIVDEQLRYSPLAPWKVAIQEMVHKMVTLPLPGDGEFFTLSELRPNQLQVEMEFLFSSSPNYVNGFIDLVFCHREKYYIIDWKTNWLETYTPKSLKAEMDAHEYHLQASIYAEALRRHINRVGDLGAAFYLFVRGGAFYHVPI